MLLLSGDYGITTDEGHRSYCGRMILKFFLSGGVDRTCLSADPRNFYSGFFDVLAALLYGGISGNLNQLLSLPYGGEFQLPYYFEIRHMLNALFGFSAMVFTGLIAKEIRGWRAAVLSFLFICLTPRFFGHSMNNPKDIPAAMAYAMTLWSMIRFLKTWPHPKASTVLCLTASLAIALGIRAGGLLLFCYLFLFSGLAWLLHAIHEKQWQVPFRMFFCIAGIATAAYFVGLLFWPYGMLDPIHHPLQALAESVHFQLQKDLPVLFDGNYFPAAQLPWFYIPKWILISVPFFIHLGLIFFAAFFRQIRLQGLFLFMLLFAVFFPVLFAILKHSVLYDSWRHFLFVYPPLVVLSALAWDYFLSRAGRGVLRTLSVGLLLLCLAEPAVWMVRFHPNESVYFNSLTGGLKGAYGRYETDYWGNSLRAASKWVASFYETQALNRPIKVKSHVDSMLPEYYLMPELGSNLLKCRRSDTDWDFWIGQRWSLPDMIKKRPWPPSTTIHAVEVDGVPLCVVLRNPSRIYDPGPRKNPPLKVPVHDPGI
jgi:hypothetical protein